MFLDSSRTKFYVPLTEIALPNALIQRLASLGITTLDELRDHWAHGNQRLIRGFLDEPLERFAAYSSLVSAVRGPAAAGSENLVDLLDAGRRRPLIQRPRGVLLTAAQRKTLAEPPEPLPLVRRRRIGSAVSLADRFPVVRNQGKRGTCVAFSAVALLEYHLCATVTDGAKPSTRARRHSEQFVYWACKEKDGRPLDKGTFVSTARGVLREYGACLNTTWPYVARSIRPTEGQGPPPDNARAEALGYVWRQVRRVAAKMPERIREQIDEARPVVLSVKTFPSWDYRITQDTGEIPIPFPGEECDGGHAVCIVGYELAETSPGGGAFIFRNSWGTKWAQPHGRFGGGYGTLPFAYVRKYGLEAFG